MLYQNKEGFSMTENPESIREMTEIFSYLNTIKTAIKKGQNSSQVNQDSSRLKLFVTHRQKSNFPHV